MSTIPKVEFRWQRGSTERWEQKNPVLGSGEPGLEVDTGRFKVGDGHTPWNDLEYFLTEDYVTGLIEVMIAETGGLTSHRELQFGRPGNLITFTGPEVYFNDDVELVEETFTLTTSPTGTSAIFDILKNGSSVYAVKPAIAVSTKFSSPGVLADTTIYYARTDSFRIQCTQIGSGIPGADLTALIKMHPVV